ncbi:MAG: hypothetical protein KGR98_11310, partial [Verrucomicrobia bacterium]|nr:hypothetical protein [Verrucomicrobiota bacterium]
MRSPPNCHSSLSLAAAWLLAIAALPAGAQAPKDQDAAWVGMTPGANGFTSWFSRVARVQAEQPHWMTPLVTVTPLLEEEYRYDQFWKRLPGGASLTSCGAGKGLELIPAQNVEVILGVPAWEYKNTSPSKSGWSDESFLLKYRLLSAKPGEGDYVATAFLGLSA